MMARFAREVREDERRYIAALMRDVERTNAPERPRDGERWARVVEMLSGAWSAARCTADRPCAICAGGGGSCGGESRRVR